MDLLKTNLKPVNITASVPVNTILSGFLVPRVPGTGIYDREGAPPGRRVRGRTRSPATTGPAVDHLQRRVDRQRRDVHGTVLDLPQQGRVGDAAGDDQPASAPTRRSSLDDPSTTGIDYATMNTVIAPYTFTAPSYSQTITSDIARGQSKHYFFRVPANTPALKVDMVGGGTAAGGSDPLPALAPFGLAIDSNAASNCYTGRRGRLHNGQPDEPGASNPRRRLGSDDRRAPALRRLSGAGAVHAAPRRSSGRGRAQPRHIASATIGTPISRVTR